MTFALWFIPGIFFLGYGFLIQATGSGSGFYMVWFSLGVLCFLLGIGAKLSLWSMISPIVRRGIGIILCIGFLLYLGTEAVILTEFGAKGERDLDVILVLGAQVKTSGPSVVLRRRLEVAEQYLKENPDTICIVSGGQGTNEPFSEAEGMAEYLIAHGIDESRILREDRSRNTVENLKFSKDLLSGEEKKIGIITNNFHVFRAIHIAKGQGITNVCGIAAPSGWPYLLNNMTREFLGVWKDFLFGNLG